MALRAALWSVGRAAGWSKPVRSCLPKGDPDTEDRLARVVRWYRTFSKLIRTHVVSPARWKSTLATACKLLSSSTVSAR